MPKRIFINIHYLEIGGAERALIGLLNTLNRPDIEVDLFVNQHTGEFMRYIPKHINLLPQRKEYAGITGPIKQVLLHGEFGIALKRLIAKRKSKIYHNSLPEDIKDLDTSSFQYLFAEVESELPDFTDLGEYDLAISFIAPHNYVLHKVRAKKKICWIHTDYSTVHINKALELPIWSGYDHIASISEDCTRTFGQTFPDLRSKIFEIENIISPEFVRSQAQEFVPDAEMPRIDGERIILSVGRFHYQKRFDEVARMCRIMLDAGAKFKWYLIGYGDETPIRQTINEYNVADTLILLGKRNNPYPYIKHCDVYVQPSRFEGKSVTVREAQILCKPIAITNFPTASSHITDGVDGLIIPFETDAAASALANFLDNEDLQHKIINYLSSHDYGNVSEVEKIYKLLN